MITITDARDIAGIVSGQTDAETCERPLTVAEVFADAVATHGFSVAIHSHRIYCGEPHPMLASGRTDHTERVLARHQWDANDYIEFPYTTWGDYCGSTTERANAAVILSDAESLAENGELDAFDVATVGDCFGSETVVVRLGAPAWDSLASTLDFIADYPSLDDEREWEIRDAIATEDWELFGRDELRDIIADVLRERLALDLFSACDVPDALADDIGAWLMGEDHLSHETETATSGYFSGMDAEHLAPLVVEWLAEHPGRIAAMMRDYDASARRAIADVAASARQHAERVAALAAAQGEPYVGLAASAAERVANAERIGAERLAEHAAAMARVDALLPREESAPIGRGIADVLAGR